MKTFVISQELLQALANYLATKPYQEVFLLIEALQKLTQSDN